MLTRPPCGPRASHPGAADAAFVGEWAGPRGCGRRDSASRAARERLRSPQRVRPLLPVRLPLRIPALASDLREGLLNTIRLPEPDEPGETLVCCRRCSLLWWVSASRDSTREYVVKTLVESYFFGVSSFPAPGDLADTRLCRAVVRCLRAGKVRWGQRVLPCGLDLAACRNLSVHDEDVGLYFYLPSRNSA